MFADATGVLRTGNTVVFRIGSDALGTAGRSSSTRSARRSPRAGLPRGHDQPGRARRATPPGGRCSPTGGWPSPSPAGRAPPSPSSARSPARPAPRSACTAPAARGWSPHRTPTPTRFAGRGRALARPQGVQHAERLLHPARRAPDLVGVFLDALDEAAAPSRHRGAAARRGAVTARVPAERFADRGEDPPGRRRARRAGGVGLADGRARPRVGVGAHAGGHARRRRRRRPRPSRCATATARTSSPRSISDDPAEHERFYAAVDAPFVGDGFTRWVDGQYALDTPELGLSNWQGGRLFARGGVLSGESVFTVRHRAIITDPDLHR